MLKMGQLPQVINKGALCAVGTCVIWGFSPIYWKQLDEVPAVQLIAHRIIWSFILLFLWIQVTNQWQEFKETTSVSWKSLLIYAVKSILVTANWTIYVWGVNAGYIVETSLGYFINPLLCVLLGVIFLRERLRIFQTVAVLIAAAGVVYLSVIYGRFPWIALSIATSFALYGLVKKLAPMGALFGLTVETGMITPLAVIYLVVLEVQGKGAFGHIAAVPTVLTMAGGIITTIPLLLFAAAAKEIPLSLIGLLMYINPTLQFLVGVLIYKEPFDQDRVIGFAMIWTACLIFGVEGFITARKEAKTEAARASQAVDDSQEGLERHVAKKGEEDVDILCDDTLEGNLDVVPQPDNAVNGAELANKHATRGAESAKHSMPAAAVVDAVAPAADGVAATATQVGNESPRHYCSCELAPNTFHRTALLDAIVLEVVPDPAPRSDTGSGQ